MIYGNPVGGALNAKTYQLECNGGTAKIMADDLRQANSKW